MIEFCNFIPKETCCRYDFKQNDEPEMAATPTKAHLKEVCESHIGTSVVFFNSTFMNLMNI